MKKRHDDLMRGRRMGRREFITMAGRLGLVIVGSGMLPRRSWAQDLAPQETTEFKVPYQLPEGKTHLRGTTLGYQSWEPWCRPYQMKVFQKHTGIKIETGIYKSSKEMLTKLASGIGETYDTFSPSSEAVKQCVKSGFFQPINLDNIPHYNY